MNFKKLSPTDFPELKPFFKHQKYRLCYYSLPSILTWSNDFYQPYGLIDNDMLIVSAEYSKSIEDRHLILPISPVKDLDPEDLRDLALKFGFDKYRYVSEDYIAEYGENRITPHFHIREQTESEDYIYLTEDMSSLKGRKFSKKRNLINQFNKRYLDLDRVKVERISSSNVSDCIDFLNKWYKEFNFDVEADEGHACEKAAIINHIKHIELLETPGIYVRIDGEISGFGLGAYLTDDMGVLHYEKAFTNIKGLYQYLDQLCANMFFKGHTYINKESDMDQPNLAKAKKSYRPVMMVKSYELKIRE